MFMAMGMGLNPILMFALYWRPRIDRKCQGTNRQGKTDTNIGRKRRVTEALIAIVLVVGGNHGRHECFISRERAHT